MKELENDNFIFKFQGCGKFLNQSLENNTIYFSSIEDFNDPFETMFNMKSWNEHSQGVDYFYKHVFPETGLARINKKYHNKIIKSRREGPAQTIYLHDDLKNSILALIRDLYGVACFTSDYRELLMWAHYAKVGKGVCLVFDKSKMFNTNKDGYPRIQSVTYEDKLPGIDVRLSENQIHFNIEPLITTKRKNWEYEKEVRAYINMGKITPFIGWSSSLLNGKDKRLRSVKFVPEALKGVVFGHKCSTRSRNQGKKALRSNETIDFDSLIIGEAVVNKHTGQYHYREEKV